MSMNYHLPSMGYAPASSQPGHVGNGQVAMNGNGGGVAMPMGSMGMSGGGIMTHQPHLQSNGGMSHQAVLQHQQHVGGGYPPTEEDYGYWAPPAPRLTAAAVRAARMEALYPYQALYASYNRDIAAPVPTSYGAYSQQNHQQHHQQQYQAQAHHHAQLEHQLMLHHQLSKLHVYPGSAAQQQAPPQAWDQQSRQAYAPKPAYSQPPPASQAYEWDYNNQQARAAHAQAYHPQGVAGAYQLPPQQPQHQLDHNIHQQNNFYPQNQGWEGRGQVGAEQGAAMQQEWHAQPAAPQQPTWQGGFQNGEAQHYHHPVQQQPHTQQPPADVAHQAEVSSVPPSGANQQAAPPTDSGPAPPSPDTLDRSAVPIASLGAEITWAACAALLEPSLLRSSLATRSPSESSQRFSAASSPSVQAPLSPWNSSSLSQSGEWGSTSDPSSIASPGGANALHRFALGAGNSGNQNESRQKRSNGNRAGNSSSPNSSASSSEPGTPPSMREDELEAERNGSGTLGDARGLGLDGVAVTGGHDFSPAKYSSQHDSRASLFGIQQRETSPQKPFRARSQSSARAAVNAATVEKMRSGVHSVLNLISPEWKWSRNDHSLRSLTDHSPLAAQSIQQSSPSSSRRISRAGSADSSRRSSIHASGSLSGSGVLGMVGSPRPITSADPNQHPSPSPSADTSPAFRRFVHQVLAQTLLSPTAFLLALLFVVRVPSLVTNADGTVDQEALQLLAQPPSAAPFKLLTLGVMISNKHLDDNTFLNKTWNEVTGIPLDELNRMERYFLKRSGFEITVPDEVWSAFILRVREREEAKVAANQKARRAQVQTHVRAATGTGSFSSPGNERRRSSSELTAAEQCSKRLLPALDEIFANLGHLPPLDLSEPCFPVVSPVSSSSNNMERFGGQLDDQSQRPSLSHQHCHSAPPSAFGSAESENDVFEEDAGPYRPYSSARASSDFSFKQAESAPQDYRMPTSRSYHARVSTGISPSRSAPISSHEQGNFNLGHRLHSLANLGYRDVLERGRAGFAPELRS